MVKYSTTIGAYTDVKAVLDAAILQGGARYELPNFSAAIAWRSRAYAFRKLLLKLAAENLPGIPPTTPYDSMLLQLDMKNKSPIVTIKVERTLGTLTTLDGKPLTIPQTTPTDTPDDLLAEALRLAKETDIEI